MKKRIMILSCLLAFTMGMRAAAAPDDNGCNGIRITTNQTNTAGEAVVYEFVFASKPTLTYINDYEDYKLTVRNIAITSSNIQKSYGVEEIQLKQDDVKSVSFVKVSDTGINDIVGGRIAVAFSPDSRQISINGLRQDESVQLYATDGRLLSTARVANGRALLSVPTAMSGTVLLVKCGSGTFKLRMRD